MLRASFLDEPFLAELIAQVRQQVEPHADPGRHLCRVQVIGLPRPADQEFAQRVEPLTAFGLDGWREIEGRPARIAGWRRDEHLGFDVESVGNRMALGPAEGELRPDLRVGLGVRRARRNITAKSAQAKAVLPYHRRSSPFVRRPHCPHR